MISKFINIINLELSEEEIKKIIKEMFYIYQPDEIISY
jgi:pyruvate formate-lyase activating enzyme-like uncharacterized protein